MNVETALRRRADLLRRLARAACFDLSGEHTEYTDRGSCPAAVYGGHGEPNWRGRCPYCDRRLRRSSARAFVRRVPDFDVEDVCDPVTMEPVDALEREETWRRWR